VFVGFLFAVPDVRFHIHWLMVSPHDNLDSVVARLGKPDSTGVTHYPAPNGQLMEPGYLNYTWRRNFLVYSVLFDAFPSETNLPKVVKKLRHYTFEEIH